MPLYFLKVRSLEMVKYRQSHTQNGLPLPGRKLHWIIRMVLNGGSLNNKQGLRIPTGWRQTSWLLYKRGPGFELGTTKNKSS